MLNLKKKKKKFLIDLGKGSMGKSLDFINKTAKFTDSLSLEELSERSTMQASSCREGFSPLEMDGVVLCEIRILVQATNDYPADEKFEGGGLSL